LPISALGFARNGEFMGKSATAIRSDEPAAPRIGRAEREARILDAAFAEFTARGYAATRLEDIARRAGVAKGLPHFYFQRKEDLFRAVVRRLLVPTWGDLVQESLSSEGPTRDVLRTTLATMYRRLAGSEKAQHVMRLLIAEGPRFPELVEFYCREVLEQKISIWRQLVALGVQRGEFRTGPLADNPLVLHGPVFMAAIWQLLFSAHHRLDLDSWIEAHFDLALNGLERPNRDGN
jgi:AcrR family transcriptional regulator